MSTDNPRRWPLPPHTVSLFALCETGWTLLTWTLTVEVIVIGLCVSAAITAVMQPLVAEAGRIKVTPRRAVHALALAGYAIGRVVVANVALSRRIWSPSMPLRTGMVTVPTKARSDAGLCTVGVVTSLIVDNQIVDVDRRRHRLLYHAIVVPEPEEAYDKVNGPVDRRVAAMEAMVDV